MDRAISWWQRLDLKQRIKLVVYPLLLLNFAHYVGNDIEQARHTFHAGWQWHDWTANFATTLDELGWFVLLLLLELETYVLSDDDFTRGRLLVMNVIRVVCYFAIGHAVFAFSEYLLDLESAIHHTGTELCSFLDQGLSFTRNLEYWELDPVNCGWLSSSSEFYVFSQGQAISDAAGMKIELELAWADAIEVVLWLFIMLFIELRIKLQDRGVSNSSLLSFATHIKLIFYGALWIIAGYWAYRDHWIFAWDEALWILGFMAIGMNLSDWQKELKEAEADSHRALNS